MFNISKYLNKFSNNINSLESDLISISDVLKKTLDLDIDIKDIEIKNYTIFLKTNNSIKNKVFINKTKILEEVSKLLNQKITNIK